MSTDTTDSLRLFHLRVLFPDLLALPKTDPRRIQAPPPITRSQPIDAELYTYIALLVRDFIHPWYRVVTTDQEFTAELVSLLTHIIQSLEDRMCNHVCTIDNVSCICQKSHNRLTSLSCCRSLSI